MFGECHAHIFMDGVNYKEARQLHEAGAQDAPIREHLRAYQERGITFVRDGGDALGVSKRARELAPEYGIDYRTPIYAIHKYGHYGSIVGHSFRNLGEFHQLVLEARQQGADFIKIMTTGLLDFANNGMVTGTPLRREEVHEMIHIAHEEGMAVMSHTNGSYGVQAAVSGGVDSVEHGNYLDEETLLMLAESSAVWVPTLVPIRNLAGCGRFSDEVLRPIIESAEQNLRRAYELGVKLALGSDGGAYRVLHGQGLVEEYEAFRRILGDSEQVWEHLRAGEQEIRDRFRRQ